MLTNVKPLPVGPEAKRAVRKERAAREFEFDASVHPLFEEIRHDTKPASITMQEIGAVADSIDVPRANMVALFRQESGAKAFEQHPDGFWYPKARLELHKLNQFTDDMFADEFPELFKRKFVISDSTAPQEEQYRRMARAITIIEGMFGSAPVWKATGWGFGQVQGFNFQHAGSGTVDRFVARIGKSEREQLQVVADFLDNTGIRKHLASGDWLEFAKQYNGKARAEGYAREIAQHFRVVTGRASA